MPLYLRISVIFITFGLWSCTPDTAETGTTTAARPDLDSVFAAIDLEVRTNSQAWQNLKTATETIGHRLTGSENGKKAQSFVWEQLRRDGFSKLRNFPFKVEAWQRGEASLRVKDNIATEGYWNVPTVSLAHSPVKVDLEKAVIDVGNGLRKHFEAKKAEVSGKVVLLNLRLDGSDPKDKNLHRTEKMTLAIEYGAAGAIFVNNVDGNVLLTGAASVTGALNPIPAMCIGKEDGQKLRGMLEEGGKAYAKVNMTNFSEEISASNVIASIEGSEFPKERIVIGGHLDSWDLSTGAIDNGIGAFAILEIARTFMKLGLKPRRGIDFVMFMGEEQGLLGSTAWVKHMKKTGEIDQIKYMLNLDMAGNPIGIQVSGREEAVPFAKSIGAKIRAVDTLFQNKVGKRAGLHSDHQPFMLEGIPIMGVISNLDRAVYKFYHSDGDDFNLVKRSDIENTARFTGMLLYALADAATLPAQRLNDNEVRDFLIKHELKEKLVLAKKWTWEE